MAVDPSNEMLATADVEGCFKLWDISNYCLVSGEEECMYSPSKDILRFILLKLSL